jgi:hypothetical protein
LVTGRRWHTRFAAGDDGDNDGMERETVKHGSRVDEAMAEDVAPLLHGSAAEESRAQESRLQEDPGVGPGIRPEAHEAPGLGISEDDAAGRADLARHLASVAFPAGRDQLVFHAVEASAPPHVVDRIRSLAADDDYPNVQAVWSALGGDTEGTHT